MLSPIPLLIKRSAYQVWPTTVALSTPPGFLVHFRRNTTTCPTEKIEWLRHTFTSSFGEAELSTSINHAEVMDLQLASFSCRSEAWETQRLIHPAPMTTRSSIDGYSKVIGLKGGGWYLEVCATGMLWLDHRYPSFVSSFCMEIFGPAKPRHGHLNRTSCCFEIAVSANQTTPEISGQRKLYGIFRTSPSNSPIFHFWIADELKIQQNFWSR